MSKEIDQLILSINRIEKLCQQNRLTDCIKIIEFKRLHLLKYIHYKFKVKSLMILFFSHFSVVVDSKRIRLACFNTKKNVHP